MSAIQPLPTLRATARLYEKVWAMPGMLPGSFLPGTASWRHQIELVEVRRAATVVPL